jgi:hypothetical protein
MIQLAWQGIVFPLRYAAWQENLESRLRGRPPIFHIPAGLWKKQKRADAGSENKNHESGGPFTPDHPVFR